jgi:hypothetical protein
VAEIGDLEKTVTVEQDVARLDVAVDGVFLLVQVPAQDMTKPQRGRAQWPSVTKISVVTYHKPLSICKARLCSAASGNCTLAKVVPSMTWARESRFIKRNASRRVYLHAIDDAACAERRGGDALLVLQGALFPCDDAGDVRVLVLMGGDVLICREVHVFLVLYSQHHYFLDGDWG